MTWTNNSEIKIFLTCWKKNPKLCCLIFGKCSNLPPEKEQSPTWIWFKIHECSNHQPENMKKQSPTILNFSLWFLANKVFIVVHKCSSHQPECAFNKVNRTITFCKNYSLNRRSLLMRISYLALLKNRGQRYSPFS